MLTVEIKVNGLLISFLNIRNLGSYTESGKTLYNVDYYDVSDTKIETFSVPHKRSEGAEKLVKLALEKAIAE